MENNTINPNETNNNNKPQDAPNNKKIGSNGSKGRKLRFGGYAVAITAVVLAALIILNVAVKAIEDKWALRLDLSYNSITKFSETTTSALSKLDKDVKFYLMAQPGSEDAQLVEVLDRFRASNSHVTFETFDPDKNPGMVNKFRGTSTSLAANTVVVTNAEESRFKVITYYDMITISVDQNTGSQYISSYNFERSLTQGMLYVTADKTQTAYFLQGHGEATLSDLAALVTFLNKNNYDTTEIALGADMPSPDASLIVICAPQRDIDDSTRAKLMEYAQSGGGFMFVWDVSTPLDLPNFNAVMAYYNVSFDSGIVVANMSDASQYVYTPTYLITKIGEHEVTNPLTSGTRSYVIAVDSLAIKMPEMPKNEVEVTPLLISGDGSFLADPTVRRTDYSRKPEEPLGPFNVAVASLHHDFVNSANESRAVLIGSATTVASSSMLNQFSNGDFVMSAMKWVAKDEAADVSVISKTATRGLLRIQSQAELYLLAGLAILLMPVIVLAVALIVNLRRRHL